MRTTIIITAALLLALPVAAANWNYRGNNEPDTLYDTAALMYQDSHTGAGERIYFNGFARVARETHYNPNVAALGSRMQPPVTAMAGVLGFWKDCNNDGYVGMLEQSFLEYRTELLNRTDICAPTTPANGQSLTGFLYPHNDGTWVRELIWIGPRTLGAIGAPSGNPTNFYADGTGVWADWGLPGGRPTLVCPGGNVGIRSVGAALDTVDCQTYYRGVATLNTIGGPVGGWDPADVDNSNSPANVQNPAYPFLYGPAEPEGNPEEGDFRGHNGGFLGVDGKGEDNVGAERRPRMFTIVNCDAPGGGVSTSPSVNTGWTSSPTNPANYPSAYESLNDTFEVIVQGDSFAGNNAQPCDASGPSDEGFQPYPSVEGYSEATNPADGRREVDFSAEFSTGSRNLVPGATCQAPASGTNFVRHPVLGFCPPADGGLAVERDDLAVGPAWRTNAQVNTHGTTTREGLRTGTPDLGAFYFTFYAKVGALAFTKGTGPSAGEIYGKEACGSATVGVVNFWHCSPAVWQARCVDPELVTLPAQCYKVGDTYHLRDVDCWDGTIVRGVGVHASLTDVASATGPCKGLPSNERPDLTVR